MHTTTSSKTKATAIPAIAQKAARNVWTKVHASLKDLIIKSDPATLPTSQDALQVAFAAIQKQYGIKKVAPLAPQDLAGYGALIVARRNAKPIKDPNAEPVIKFRKNQTKKMKANVARLQQKVNPNATTTDETESTMKKSTTKKSPAKKAATKTARAPRQGGGGVKARLQEFFKKGKKGSVEAIAKQLGATESNVRTAISDLRSKNYCVDKPLNIVKNDNGVYSL